MPPRSAHSDWPAVGFAALGAIPSFLLLEGGWVTSPRRPDRGEERESREGPVVSGRRAGPGPRREPPARRRWAECRSRRRVGPRWQPPRERESRGRQKNEALGCSAAGTKPTVPSPSAAPAPPPPPQGARQVLGGPAPGPDPSLSRPPGSLFLSFLLPFPRSGRLRFLPRLSLKLRRSASSQNNKGQGGGDARREGASEGGRGSPRGTLGSVVRDAGEGCSAPPAAVDPGAPSGMVAKEGGEASPRVTPRHLGFPGDRGTFEGSSLWIAILAQPSVSSEFVLCRRSGVGGGEEGGRVLDSVESETAWRKTARPGESAIPGFLPARLKGRDQEGEVAGSAPRRPACRGGQKETLPDWCVLVPGAALPEWWERLVDPKDSVESISGAF